MFEVQDLRYATLATVSRCGMVWFSEDVLTMDMIFDNFLSKLRNVSIDDSEDDSKQFSGTKTDQKDEDTSPAMQASYWLPGHVLLSVSVFHRYSGSVLIYWLPT